VQWHKQTAKEMCTLQLPDRGWRQQPLEWVLQQRWEESALQAALATLFRARWQGLTQGDPGSAPSKGILKLAHNAWVYSLDPCFDPISRDNAPPISGCACPLVLHATLPSYVLVQPTFKWSRDGSTESLSHVLIACVDCALGKDAT
jgi:hypothetical protein